VNDETQRALRKIEHKDGDSPFFVYIVKMQIVHHCNCTNSQSDASDYNRPRNKDLHEEMGLEPYTSEGSRIPRYKDTSRQKQKKTEGYKNAMGDDELVR